MSWEEVSSDETSTTLPPTNTTQHHLCMQHDSVQAGGKPGRADSIVCWTSRPVCWSALSGNRCPPSSCAALPTAGLPTYGLGPPHLRQAERQLAKKHDRTHRLSSSELQLHAVSLVSSSQQVPESLERVLREPKHKRLLQRTALGRRNNGDSARGLRGSHRLAYQHEARDKKLGRRGVWGGSWRTGNVRRPTRRP